MDELAGFLEGPRARGAFVLRSVLDPPWALRVEDRAPLTVVVVVRGRAVVVHDGTDPVALTTGDVAIVRGPDPYTVADDARTRPHVVIHPGQRCTTPDGTSLTEAMRLGVRTWGTDPNGAVSMLTGTYHSVGEVSRRLLDALPRLAVLRADEWRNPVVDLLADEAGRDDPGQEVVLDRLLDLVLIGALRAWFARPGAAPPWYAAHTDAVVGHALRLIHHEPARPWTVAALASAVGASRAVLARRFHDLVGEPPMTFLTNWRMALAADLLLEPDATVGAVSRHVGYASPFTFSAAFKRVHGVSPSEHRLLAGTAPPAA